MHVRKHKSFIYQNIKGKRWGESTSVPEWIRNSLPYLKSHGMLYEKLRNVRNECLGTMI